MPGAIHGTYHGSCPRRRYAAGAAIVPAGLTEITKAAAMDKTQPTTKRMLNVRFILLLTLIEKWLYAWITLLAGQFYRLMILPQSTNRQRHFASRTIKQNGAYRCG